MNLLLILARGPRLIRLPCPAADRAPDCQVVIVPDTLEGPGWRIGQSRRAGNPSADPGAKTGAGGRMPPLGIPGLAQMR